MAHSKRFFEVDVREAYMGNMVPLKFEVKVTYNDYQQVARVELVVLGPENMKYHADEIDIEAFNE